MVAPADIGLACYEPSWRADGVFSLNHEVMGWSSGKVADFLLVGKPVIVNRCTGLAELVDRMAAVSSSMIPIKYGRRSTRSWPTT